MEKQPDIVPIQLDNQNDFDPMTHERQLAFEIKDTNRNRTVSVYQGIEKIHPIRFVEGAVMDDC